MSDLEAVQDGITSLALAELAARVSADVAGRSGRAALWAYADALRAYSRDSPGRWEALQRRAGTPAVDSRAAGSFVAVTDAVLRAYRFSPVDRVHATRLLGSLINGFIALERIGSFDHREPEPEASWAIALDALDALFTTRPATLVDDDLTEGTPRT